MNINTLIFHHYLKWYKPNCQRGLSGTVFFNRVELAFIISKGNPIVKLINRKIMYQDIITCNNTLPNDKDAVDHPARRPVDLYQKIIMGFTQKNDLILDPFFGSGTTGVACEKLGRKWIGIELSEKYCEIAKRRIDAEYNQIKMELG